MYAYYALHELKILPHDLANMTLQQKAMIFALIDERVRVEKRRGKKK